MSGKVIKFDPMLRAIEELVERFPRPPRRLVAITVDPEWPRGPIGIVADPDMLPGGFAMRGDLEIRRSKYLRPDQMVLHYSDGSIEIMGNAPDDGGSDG